MWHPDRAASASTRPCDNPFRAQRLDALRYAEDGVVVDEVVEKLRQKCYRGALVGPHGTGKTTLLREVGDRLIGEGLSPMPLFINSDERGTLPRHWRSAIRMAGHGDALLLDGYDLLPLWARAWVLHASRGASAVVVTSHRRCVWKTVAKTTSSPAVLRRLVSELTEEDDAALIDCDALWHKHQGNLRDALRELYDRH
ncbi:hypothetical protein OT109_12955 [Phycisphaeraceae bacterium D3-23]